MPAKHALIVGIDQYSNFEERYQLSGCVNDARLIKSILIEHFDFNGSEITELHNAAASQQGILQAMDRLANQIGHDDIVVFHFSGHGSRRTSSKPDEGTGMDSTITPADSGCVDPFPNLDIIDDVIHEWLERLSRKTRNITLIFDCCHSGTITRDASSAKVRGVPADRRSLPAMGVDPARLPARRKTEKQRAGSVNWLEISDAYVVISGCRDDEYSHEYAFEQDGEMIRSGALTHFLTRALLQARPGTTYRDVFELARQGVNTRFPQQHPQIEGAQEREIFGVRDIEPLRFISVVSVDGGSVTLGGGAAHGLLVGSLWTAYPPGTKQTRDSAPLATIEITRVGTLTSGGRIRSREAELPVGARCVESAPAASQFLLSVDLSALDASADQNFRQHLVQSKLLALAQTSEAADMRVQLLKPGQASSPSEAGPRQTASVEEATWEIVDRAGQRAMPLRAVDGDAAIEALLGNLESIARFRNALALDNPASSLAVEFNIYRVNADGELENANGGDFVFDEGDRLAFEIVNHEDRNIFVNVLNFGLTGGIALLYPPGRAGEMIAPGKSIRIGVGEQRMTLEVPKSFQAKRGTEALKAFISTDETDFRWLQQGGMRSLGSASTGLRRHFEAAYLGPATRDVVLNLDDGAGEDWKATTRAFDLQRRLADDGPADAAA